MEMTGQRRLPVGRKAAWDALYEAQYKTIVDSARSMAKFDARHIEDVFQIRLDENKSLICVTPKLDIGKQGQFRLELETLIFRDLPRR